jgi:hypothetical protein
MKKIFIRSPYFIEVDEVGQTSAKIEVFLWNKDTTEPTIPNYTFTKPIPSPTQTKLSWNVSNLAKSFIKPIAPVMPSLYPAEENVNTWCYMKVVRYSDDVELDDETFVCLNGYTNYLEGYNQINEDTVIGLSGNQKIYYNTISGYYLNVWIEPDPVEFETIVEWYNGSTLIDSSVIVSAEEDASMFKIPIKTNTTELRIIQEDTRKQVFLEELCEPIYTPVVCTYINRFGGWQYFTFFKANSQGIDVKSKDYNLLPSSIDFNPLQGVKQRFNFQGTQKIKCNTGWVDENYSELIQDLMLSEVVLLDNKPAIVKSQSADIKTHLKDNNINYEVEFEYNYGLINDVI